MGGDSSPLRRWLAAGGAGAAPSSEKEELSGEDFQQVSAAELKAMVDKNRKADVEIEGSLATLAWLDEDAAPFREGPYKNGGTSPPPPGGGGEQETKSESSWEQQQSGDTTHVDSNAQVGDDSIVVDSRRGDRDMDEFFDSAMPGTAVLFGPKRNKRGGSSRSSVRPVTRGARGRRGADARGSDADVVSPGRQLVFEKHFEKNSSEVETQRRKIVIQRTHLDLDIPEPNGDGRKAELLPHARGYQVEEVKFKQYQVGYGDRGALLAQTPDNANLHNHDTGLTEDIAHNFLE